MDFLNASGPFARCPSYYWPVGGGEAVSRQQELPVSEGTRYGPWRVPFKIAAHVPKKEDNIPNCF